MFFFAGTARFPVKPERLEDGTSRALRVVVDVE